MQLVVKVLLTIGSRCIGILVVAALVYWCPLVDLILVDVRCTDIHSRGVRVSIIDIEFSFYLQSSCAIIDCAKTVPIAMHE